MVGPVVEFFDGLGDDEQARLDELERENAELRAQLRTSELARNRAAELDALLRVAGAGQYRTVPAQVIAVGPAQGFASTATIDAGEIDGLRPEMTVLNGDGLVGRVKSVTRTTALVVLLEGRHVVGGGPPRGLDGPRDPRPATAPTRWRCGCSTRR